MPELPSLEYLKIDYRPLCLSLIILYYYYRKCTGEKNLDRLIVSLLIIFLEQTKLYMA